MFFATRSPFSTSIGFCRFPRPSTTLALIACAGFMVFMGTAQGAPNEWTWIKGSNSVSQHGTYGTQGTPHPANTPGARRYSMSWMDSTGNFWLFGGAGFAASGTSSYLNDLWKYDPASNLWTWVKGSNAVNQNGIYGTQGTPDPANTPGARSGSISWTDTSGNLWLFGGYGYAASGSGRLNDLWKYDPSTKQWTWMKGSNAVNQNGIYGTQESPHPANTPGARDASVSWTDSTGNLWLFGGAGFAASGSSSYLNDLWKYDPASNLWTWMKGSNTVDQNGIYGIQGTPNLANTPGARSASIEWTDSAGNLWLFGGNGFPASGSSSYLNDLWKYDPVTKQWMWVGGSNVINQYGTYGMQGTPDQDNIPGARRYSVSWRDHTGNLWLFGGYGYTASGSTGQLNDLWKYDLDTKQWTWVKGSNTVNQYGIYGTQGTPDSANTPGSRYYPTSWIDSTGNLWLFSGQGFAASAWGDLNDLWKFDPLGTSSIKWDEAISY